MTIRRAIPDDLPNLIRMGREFHAQSCCANTIPFSDANFASAISDIATNAASVLFVFDAGAAGCIGMAAAISTPYWFNASKRIGQELFWWVDVDQRGTQAGMHLLDALEAWAADMGCAVFSMASTANIKPKALARLYRRRGYAAQDIYYVKEF
ncbi:GNAT family N-acetyltransferase [Herminiimonas sp. CN]|uniref:GNAT family N-acetyltransferase n=1 Tax=Herminiimonas sp. CN TaxID=1349818 RepID=UPI000473BEDA|nr:GNAT family N-acetyltransferase [Herminiimonas sp. CN]